MTHKQMTATFRDAERAHDILPGRRPILSAMLAPKSVAVIGATETPDSIGRVLMENLRAFPGGVHPVHPTRRSVLGRPAFRTISDVPGKVDLAVIATPAATVPDIVGQCAEAGVKGAIVISAGFKECGPAGAALEKEILARRGAMRIIGPNCLGAMIPRLGLNATFAAGMALPGSVAFVSQSGALCTAVLDWSVQENVGFSAFISIGSMLDVDWGDLIYHLGDDPHTKSIVIYMESIGNARAFLSAAREVALIKPIIVIKVGRTAPAARAAASHTGSLTGNDEVLDAAFMRVGVLRVNTIAELFAMAELLGKQPRPNGPRLAIVTNAGGPGGLATDALITGGAELAALGAGSTDALNKLLPPHWSHNNPVDILGDAGATRYARAVEIVSRDPNTDGVLVILTPQAMTDAAATATQLKPFAKLAGKPVLASWMGGGEVAEGEAILNAAGIPTFKHPDTAARAFAYMWRYTSNLRSLYETPVLLPESEETAAHRALAEQIVRAARKSKRTILTEAESKQILAAYGIPTAETRVATGEGQAVRIAKATGYPVVLKIHSETITHKSDIGGVKLDLRDAASVRRAYREIEAAALAHAGARDFLGVTVQPMISRNGFELILGSTIDPQFGPVLLFGTGGRLVEVFKDRALGLPPLTATLARRIMEQTRIYAALRGVRGRKAVDLAALEQLIVRFSHLVAEQRLIREIDINPLLASGDGFVALDARVIAHDPGIPEADLPAPAIRPYPVQYITAFKLKGGPRVKIRPIRPEDEPLMRAFHATLSEQSVRSRYFAQLNMDQRVAHERLTRICFNDYDREIALVVEHRPPRTRDREIIGVGRLGKLHGLDEGEFAILISDRWQRRGLGTELLKLLVQIGRKEKLSRVLGHILPDNIGMQRVSRKAGFDLRQDSGDGEMIAEILL